MRVAFVRHDPSGPVLAGVRRPAGVRPAVASAGQDHEVEAIPARLDVVDKGDRFSVKVDLPGVSKEDINVAVEGARLSVSGARRPVAANSAAPEQIKVLRAERPATRYARTLQLPQEVDGNAADASFENGVLTLTLPKRVQLTQITVR